MTTTGRYEVVDLIPNGRNVMVTDDNKLEYVQRITHHRMTHSIRTQIEAFLEGGSGGFFLSTESVKRPWFLQKHTSHKNKI